MDTWTADDFGVQQQDGTTLRLNRSVSVIVLSTRDASTIRVDGVNNQIDIVVPSGSQIHLDAAGNVKVLAYNALSAAAPATPIAGGNNDAERVALRIGTPQRWQPNTFYDEGDLIVDVNGNTQKCVKFGTSGTIEPVWTVHIGDLVPDIPTVGDPITWSLNIVGNGPVTLEFAGASAVIDAGGNWMFASPVNISLNAAGSVNIYGTQGVNIQAGTVDHNGGVLIASNVKLSATAAMNAIAQQEVTIQSVQSGVFMHANRDAVVLSDQGNIGLNANNNIGLITQLFNTSVQDFVNIYNVHTHPGVTTGGGVTGSSIPAIQ